MVGVGGVWGCVCPALIHVPHTSVVPLNISPAMGRAWHSFPVQARGAARPLSSALPAWGPVHSSVLALA